MNQLRLTAVLVPTCIAVLAFSACSAIKPAVHDANDLAARLLCEEAFVEKTGLSPAEVRELYCESQEALAPFLEALKQSNGSNAPSKRGALKNE